jgi:hypothetical protein
MLTKYNQNLLFNKYYTHIREKEPSRVAQEKKMDGDGATLFVLDDYLQLSREFVPRDHQTVVPSFLSLIHHYSPCLMAKFARMNCHVR